MKGTFPKIKFTQSFTRSVCAVCTLIEDLKDKTGLFYSYDDGKLKMTFLFEIQSRTKKQRQVMRLTVVSFYGR